MTEPWLDQALLDSDIRVQILWIGEVGELHIAEPVQILIYLLKSSCIFNFESAIQIWIEFKVGFNEYRY